MIKKGWDGDYELRHRDGTAVQLPHQWQDRDATLTIYGGRAPHNANSSGRIWLRSEVGDGGGKIERELYPHVADMRWVKL